MLRLANITKRYSGKTVVDSIDLGLARGETSVLIGPSGCGKSTLLRMMIGLISPDGGTVYLQDQPLDQNSIKSVRRDFGYVIQSGGLFPHLTAEQNVSLPAVYANWPRSQIRDRVDQLRKLTHLPADNLSRYPAQLSGGQRQRISLMRALVLEPSILLLDEPLGALDPMIRSELQSELKEIFQSLEKTVVMVTHDLNEAAFFGDQIVLMRDGGIVQKGTIADLTRRPIEDFVSDFIQAQQSHLISTNGGAT